MKKLIDTSENHVEYKIEMAKSKYNLENTAQRVEYVQEVASILSLLNSSVEIDVYAGKIAEETGVEKNNILTEVKRLLSKSKSKFEKKLLDEDRRKLMLGATGKAGERGVNLKAKRAEEMLICLMFYHSNLYESAKALITKDDFFTEFNKKIYESITERIEKEEIPHISMFSMLSSAENSAVVGILMNKDNYNGTKEEVLECCETLQALREKREISSALQDDEALRNYIKNKNK